ncbi:MAG: hypothetical protein ACW98D_04455 [Promethearchaeota archaeon]|jgi:hypothetical protein
MIEMIFSFLPDVIDNPINDILKGLEGFCMAFNEFMIIFFGYMKYILVFLLITIGIMTLLKLRGIYIKERYRKGDKKIGETSALSKPRLILGIAYIVMGFGILFNFFTYFLMLILEPLPDRLIFNFLDFAGNIDPFDMNRIMDLNAAIYPHEQTIYYCAALASFGAVVDLVIAVWYMVNRITYSPRTAFTMLTGGVMTGILAGFTTCLPLFV